MTEKPDNTGKKQDGRFRRGASGNPSGRPRGTRNKATIAIQTLLDGEAKALTRKAVDMAMSGDTVALRLCLERILPPRKDSPVTIDLPPIGNTADAVGAQSAIIQATCRGEITPTEASTLSAIIEVVIKAFEAQDMQKRLGELETLIMDKNKK